MIRIFFVVIGVSLFYLVVEEEEELYFGEEERRLIKFDFDEF